jgi:DNA-binding GntR family transcriptional regulator
LVDYQRLAAGQGSLLEYLSEHRSLPIAYSRSAIYAVEADAALAGRLGVAEGKAILHLAETVYTDADAPIAHFRNYFITDCYHLKIVRRISRATGLIDRAAPEDSQHGTI